MSSRRDSIIEELETEYGVECDGNFDPDALCNGDNCRHSECDCWNDFRHQVQDHLDEQKQKQRLQGSLSVWDLREALSNAGDVDAPVFVDGKPINEAWWDGDGYHITTKEAK